MYTVTLNELVTLNKLDKLVGVLEVLLHYRETHILINLVTALLRSRVNS